MADDQDKPESLQMKVANRLKEIAPEVEGRIIDVLIEREVDKRTNALIKVVDALDKCEKDFKRLGPDVETFDENGASTSKSFSKARIDARAKERKRLNRMEGAINKALTNNDYGDIYNLAAGKETGDDASGKASSES